MSDNFQNTTNCDQTILNIEHTAVLLGVSTATARNWIRRGLMPAHSYPNTNGRFCYKKDIESVKTKIVRGDLKKLDKRANKTVSQKQAVFKEYVPKSFNRDRLRRIVAFIKKHNIDTTSAMFLIGLNFLKKQGILSVKMRDIIKGGNLYCENRQIEEEINLQLQEINYRSLKPGFSFLLDCELPEQRDSMGSVYQSLLNEGGRSRTGSYYTPQNTVDGIVQDYVSENAKAFDPCCGTGQFLLSFAETIKNPLNIYGFDTDKTAVKTARLNLLVKFKHKNFVPRVFHKNSLLDTQNYSLFDLPKINNNNVAQKFDIIAANPPWGARFSKNEIKSLHCLYPDIKSVESFSYFLRTSLDRLCSNGTASFILPEAVLNVKAHKDIREIILKKSCIIKIVSLGRVFKSVFTPVVRLDFKKTDKRSGKTRIFNTRGEEHTLKQEKWLKNPFFVFSIHTKSYDLQIIEKIYKTKHISLKNRSVWALGIVTGDNSAFISKTKKPGFQPVYKGTDVEKFVFKKPSLYMKLQPEKFQQMAPLEKYYVKEKLVYRFISKKLIFAYDNKKRLTLNSANILIPKIESYPIKAILALFNSSLYQFIFQKSFSSFKVLRHHLEDLPLPLWNKAVFCQITDTVNEILKGAGHIKNLNDFIMSNFSLSQKEKDYIRSFEGKIHGNT